MARNWNSASFAGSPSSSSSSRSVLLHAAPLHEVFLLRRELGLALLLLGRELLRRQAGAEEVHVHALPRGVQHDLELAALGDVARHVRAAAGLRAAAGVVDGLPRRGEVVPLARLDDAGTRRRRRCAAWSGTRSTASQPVSVDAARLAHAGTRACACPQRGAVLSTSAAVSYGSEACTRSVSARARRARERGLELGQRTVLALGRTALPLASVKHHLIVDAHVGHADLDLARVGRRRVARAQRRPAARARRARARPAPPPAPPRVCRRSRAAQSRSTTAHRDRKRRSDWRFDVMKRALYLRSSRVVHHAPCRVSRATPRAPKVCPTACSASSLERSPDARATRSIRCTSATRTSSRCAAARAEAQRSSERPRLHNYAPVQGEPELLDAILDKVQRRSGVALERDCVQVMAGATGGLGVVCSALLEPGDELLLPAPFWPLIRGAAALRGARAGRGAVLHRARQARLRSGRRARARDHAAHGRDLPEQPAQPDRRDRCPSRSSRASPSSRCATTCGCSPTRSTRTCGSSEPPRSIWARPELRERAIVTHSVSKAYGLAGARVGFTHGPRAIMQVIRGVQTFYTYCAPRPMQLGAARALAEGDDVARRGARASTARPRARSADALRQPPPAGRHVPVLRRDAVPAPGRDADRLPRALPRRRRDAHARARPRARPTATGRGCALPPCRKDELDAALERLQRRAVRLAVTLAGVSATLCLPAKIRRKARELRGR